LHPVTLDPVTLHSGIIAALLLGFGLLLLTPTVGPT
jgi:hypothetical protein